MEAATFKRNRDYVGYLMIAPAYSIYFLFIVVPILTGFYYSFTNYDFYKTKDFIGLRNYIGVFGDALFRQSLANTLIYSLCTIVPIMVMGMILAVLLNKNITGRRFYRSVLYIPNVTSMVAISMIWLWIYDPTYGILNRMMKIIGAEPVQWLFNPKTAMGCVIIMSIWRGIGYNMVVYLAGLQSIPQSLYEAAKVDGASGLRQFFTITIPMLKPTTFFLFVTGCVGSFMVFEQVNILTSGGPLNTTTTIVHQIYLNAFQNFRMGYASAMAMVLLVITAAITMINFKYGNQGNDLDID